MRKQFIRSCQKCGVMFSTDNDRRYLCPECWQTKLMTAYGEFVKRSVDIDEKKANTRMQIAGFDGLGTVLLWILYTGVAGGVIYLVRLLWMAVHH